MSREWKTLLARTMPGIMPEMSMEESLHVTGNSELPSLNGMPLHREPSLGVYILRVGLEE